MCFWPRRVFLILSHAGAFFCLVAALTPTSSAHWGTKYIEDHCNACPQCCITIDETDWLIESYVQRAVECGAQEWVARELLHVEELSGIPDRLRGMTLAKACFESRFNPLAIGDGGKAHGIFQLWPWALQFIDDRTDPVASAYVLLGRLVTTVRTVRRRCPNALDRWRVAWIRINRGPYWRRQDRLGEPRCGGTSPAGMKRLRRWRREALAL